MKKILPDNEASSLFIQVWQEPDKLEGKVRNQSTVQNFTKFDNFWQKIHIQQHPLYSFLLNENHFKTLWTLITENAERWIRHYCTPLQIVRQKPNSENYNEAV